MGRLVYSAITTLDGYVADENGDFSWGMPDEDVHAAINDRERTVGTYLYGRRLYEVMAAWETMPVESDPSPVFRDYAEIWRAAEKVVYSGSLQAASTSRTRIERRFEPDAVRRLIESAPTDVSIGGAELGALALRSGLVHGIAAYVVPVTVGGGTKFLPDGLRMNLELVEERRFTSGMVLLRYGVRPRP
jgi:dihydrofolate reductase